MTAHSIARALLHDLGMVAAIAYAKRFGAKQWDCASLYREAAALLEQYQRRYD